MTVEVLWKKFHPDALIPEYAHDNDSGADLRWYGAVEVNGDLRDLQGFTLHPGATARCWLGYGVRLPEGYELQIRPRSGMSSKGVLAAFGTCDEGYLGQIAVVLTSLAREQIVIRRGDKLAQAVIAKRAPQMRFIEVDDLGTSERLDRGFGSTGR